MRIFSGVVLCCAVMVLAAPVSADAACPYEDVAPTADTLEQARAALVCLHNQERKASGVRAVRSNVLLDSSAGAHSTDMVARRYFSHDTPDGLDPFARMRRAGYIRRGGLWNAGENIAWGSGRLATPRSVFDAWMDSTGHRLTMLASDFNEIGIGISLGAPSSEYAHLTSAVTYTVDFGWRDTRKPCARKSRARTLRQKCRIR
jgi:uncharacterized protein YkwD